MEKLKQTVEQFRVREGASDSALLLTLCALQITILLLFFFTLVKTREGKN